MKTNIETSARHLHLTREDFILLFNKEKLSVRNYLFSAKDEFAANETVEIVGPEGRLLNVRIAGPFRDHSQVEISKTDARNLGIDAPLRLSGDKNGAPIRVIGPKAEFTKNLAMVPKRHLHLSPKLAEKVKLKHSEQVKIKIGGDRGLVFDNVIVRVDQRYKNHFHLDTDEANAAGIDGASQGEILLKE